MKIELKESRIILTQMGLHDSVDMVRHLKTGAVQKNTLSIPFPYTEMDALSQIEKYENSDHELAIRLKCSNTFIGRIGACQASSLLSHTAIIGYWLGEEFWGKGLMTEAALAFSMYCFGSLGYERLEATCQEENVASARVLQKCGFLQEGTIRGRYKINGVLRNAKLYGLIKT